jgi:hypothetical protein
LTKLSDDEKLRILKVRATPTAEGKRKSWELVAEETHHAKATVLEVDQWLQALPCEVVRQFPEPVQHLRKDYIPHVEEMAGSGSWKEEHTKELFYFGQRLGDRLSPHSVRELVQPGVGVQQGELWVGQPNPFLSDQPIDHLEKRVEEEWGALRYDARKHSLFENFQEHLAGHPCWPALEQMEVSFQEQRKAWGQAYVRVLNKIKKKLAELKRSDIDAQPIANSLMAYAYEEGKLEFSYELDSSEQSGRVYWYLKLGAFNVGHEEDPETLKPIIELHRELKEKVLSWKSIRTFQQRNADVRGKVEEFQKYLSSDAQLRKLLLESRCESWP